jgi:hypothetical protein
MEYEAMPYEKTASRLESLIAQALRTEEVASATEQAALTDNQLKMVLLTPSLEAKSPKFWNAAAQEIEEYDELEGEIEGEMSKLGRHDPLRSRLEERLQTAREEVESVVLERGILPELRTILSHYLFLSYDTNFSYGTELTLSTAPGLAEVSEPTFVIPTESTAELHRLLTIIPGGSIGIAGPRGAGKTTLLESFCGKTSTTKLKGRPVLSVMANPGLAEYEVREFLFHIFSLLCQRVLELKNSSVRGARDYTDQMQTPFSKFLPKAIGWKEALACVLLGLFLVISSLLTDLLMSNSPAFFSLGLFLLILGFAGLLLQVSVRMRRQMQLGRPSATKREHDEPLVVEAHRWLLELRFQQSYSSKRMGHLKGTIAPIEAQAQAEYTVELAQNELSLPEIINGYREFIRLASEEYEILIGIDDLDKTESEEQAQTFLRKFRAVSGLAHCFYLISISETASSNFELRESPVHDEVDSFFEDIVYVDYFKNLYTARRLLVNRAVGVPAPFLDLCYCIAGERPRALVRTLRTLFEQSTSNPSENNLSKLCASLIRSDLKSKLRAASVAAQDFWLEPEATDLFNWMRRLEAMLEPDVFPQSSPQLLSAYRNLIYTVNPESAPQEEPVEIAVQRQRIALLAAELGLFLYYSVTLLEFFGYEDLDVETLRYAERSGALDNLARARQFFNTRPYDAENMITHFRNILSMAVPSS